VGSAGCGWVAVRPWPQQCVEAPPPVCHIQPRTHSRRPDGDAGTDSSYSSRPDAASRPEQRFQSAYQRLPVPPADYKALSSSSKAPRRNDAAPQADAPTQHAAPASASSRDWGMQRHEEHARPEAACPGPATAGRAAAGRAAAERMAHAAPAATAAASASFSPESLAKLNAHLRHHSGNLDSLQAKLAQGGAAPALPCHPTFLWVLRLCPVDAPDNPRIAPMSITTMAKIICSSRGQQELSARCHPLLLQCARTFPRGSAAAAPAAAPAAGRALSTRAASPAAGAAACW